jgi:prepilin-type N-terminal cleavage/methylation domain-containing protein
MNNLIQKRNRGYSLVEVMVAATIFTIVTLGIYSAVIQSYKMAQLSRCHDETRGILRTYVDQFQRLQTTDKINGPRWLFNPTQGPTGQGLVMGTLNDQPISNGAAAVAYLGFTLGANTDKIPAQLTRDVTYINITTGETSSTPGNGSAYLLQAIFCIEFKLNSRNYKQSVTTLRSVP